MQVDSAPQSTGSGDMPGQAGPHPAELVAGDHAGDRYLLDGLTVTVTPDPGPARLADWDRLVAGTANSDVAQLSAWPSIRRMAGYQPLYLLASSASELLGGALLLCRPVRGLGRVGYLPYGPILAGDLGASRVAVRLRLVAALADVGRAHTALFVQPPDSGTDITVELQHGFRFSQAGIALAATMRVALGRPEQELRANLSRRLRTWTRQWPQRGVKVRVGDRSDIPTLAALAASTASYQDFAPFPADYLEAIHRELSPGGHVVLLIGEVAGEPVAAELLTGSGGVLKSRVTGLDRTSAEASKLNVASAMIWEAICWGKANGYRY